MSRPPLEVAEVFREYGQAYRHTYGASMSLEQRRVMHAIEACRTDALGGHVDRCDQCGHQVISYNSCRNRHCPKCRNIEKALWREARRGEVLPVDYYHVVFTLPHALAPVALQNKKAVYDLLFRTVSQTLLRIAADPKHLGAQLGFMAVLHTWGQTLTHHPHLHCVVPGGGLAPDGEHWIPCKKGFFLPVRVLSRLFRRLFLEALEEAFNRGDLEFHGTLTGLREANAFEKLLHECRQSDWVVYAKAPFAGADAVLDYLARYTHRIAISNHRLIAMEDGDVTFSYRDYKAHGVKRPMTLPAHEFIRRFLLHVLPNGFQRIRYYGFLANRHRAKKLALCRRLLQVPEVVPSTSQDKRALIETLIGTDPDRCPRCQNGQLTRFALLAPTPAFHRRSHAQSRSP